MSARKFIDTNVLVYRFDHDEAAKRDRAREILDEEASAGRLVLSTQVLQEFYVSVTRKLSRPLAESDALEAVKHLSALPVVQIDRELVIDAIVLSRDHRISLWDSLILHAAARGGCAEVLTEDLQDGWAILGLKVVNPFADLAESSSTG